MATALRVCHSSRRNAISLSGSAKLLSKKWRMKYAIGITLSRMTAEDEPTILCVCCRPLDAASSCDPLLTLLAWLIFPPSVSAISATDSGATSTSNGESTTTQSTRPTSSSNSTVAAPRAGSDPCLLDRSVRRALRKIEPAGLLELVDVRLSVSLLSSAIELGMTACRIERRAETSRAWAGRFGGGASTIVTDCRDCLVSDRGILSSSAWAAIGGAASTARCHSAVLARLPLSDGRRIVGRRASLAVILD